MPARAHLQPDHDETLIARFAADDVTGAEAASAARRVADCPACAELHADLRSIMAATATLPAPRRTRDFRLTEADAARLQRTGWRRLLGRFGDPRLAFTRPLATGLVTLGIAGLLLSAAPSLLAAPGIVERRDGRSGGRAGCRRRRDDRIHRRWCAGRRRAGSRLGFGRYDGRRVQCSGLGAAAAGGPESGSVRRSSVSRPWSGLWRHGLSRANAADRRASTAADLGNGAGGIGAPAPAGPVVDQNPGVGKSADASAATSSAPSLFVLASLVLVVLGLGLFVLRWMARRTA